MATDLSTGHRSASARATTDGSGGNAADTYGWDTVFAVNFSNANSALTANWANVSDGAKTMHQEDSGFVIDAVFGPWQLTTGGDGQNIRMECPVASGLYNADGQQFPLDEQNLAVVIEVGMQWVPDPSQLSFVISDQGDVGTITTDLNANQIDTTLQAAFTANNLPLASGATARVQLAGEEWRIASGNQSFYIFHSSDSFGNVFLSVYQFTTAWLNNLKLLAKSAISDEPAVSIITIVNNPAGGVPGAVLSSLLSEWFNANIAEFNHVFAVLDLAPTVSGNDKFAWMKPTATSYAVTDQGTLDSSVFGVLTMVGGNQPSDNHQVSPYAIPTPAQAGFLISGPMFVQNMLLAGAMAIFDNASEDNFIIDNDGLTVRNSTALVWGKFMMDNQMLGAIPANDLPGQLDQGGTAPQELTGDLAAFGIYAEGGTVTVTSAGSQWLLDLGGGAEYILDLDGDNIDVYAATVVNIDEGDFTMTLMGTYVEIQFVDLLYSYSSNYDVHVDYTEQVQLELQSQSGKQIFWFNPAVSKDLVVNVTETKSAITREIVEGAVTAALALISIIGPIVEGCMAGAQIGEVTDEAGNAVVDSETISNAEQENPEGQEQNEQDAGNKAGQQSSGKLVNIKNAFATPKWKFMGAIVTLAILASGGDSTVSAIIKSAVTGDWENVPGFDDFSDQMISPYTWPQVSGYPLQSAALATSLQIGLQVSQS